MNGQDLRIWIRISNKVGSGSVPIPLKCHIGIKFFLTIGFESGLFPECRILIRVFLEGQIFIFRLTDPDPVEGRIRIRMNFSRIPNPGSDYLLAQSVDLETEDRISIHSVESYTPIQNVF